MKNRRKSTHPRRNRSSLWTRLICPGATGLALLVGTLASAFASNLQYQWGHPKPQGNAIFGLSFRDDSAGWAVGEGGFVLRTTQGGEAYEVLVGPTLGAGSLNDVLALPSGAVLAVGGGERVYRSIDDGVTWDPIPNPVPGELRDLAEFPGGITAAGENGGVILSTDEGLTWTEVGPGVGTIRHHFWQTADEGYVVGGDVAHRTTDGGDSWTRMIDFNAFGYNEVYFSDALHGYVIEDFGTWESTDGGDSWTEFAVPTGPHYRFRTLVLSQEHWLTVTILEGAELWETFDAGESWTQVNSRQVVGYPCLVQMPNGRIAFGSDIGDLFWSDDLGQTVENATTHLVEDALTDPVVHFLQRPDGVLYAANQPSTGGSTPLWAGAIIRG